MPLLTGRYRIASSIAATAALNGSNRRGDRTRRFRGDGSVMTGKRD